MPVADTSRTAFEQIIPRLSTRQRLILSTLETWQGTPPDRVRAVHEIACPGRGARPERRAPAADGAESLRAGSRCGDAPMHHYRPVRAHLATRAACAATTPVLEDVVSRHDGVGKVA